MNKYPENKDSGAEWIGVIPKHWDVRRVATLGVFSKGRGISREEVKPNGLPCIRYGEIYTNYERIVSKTISCIDDDSSEKSERIAKGNLLFTASGETLDEIGKAIVYYGEEDIYVGGDIVILKLYSGISPLFMSFLLNSNLVNQQKTKFGRGGIIVHIYPKQLREILLPLPPLIEQTFIARFLDDKTTHIDDLITKKKRLIELLKEEHTSVINQAVTKGLDPNATMKDSGINWLGKIPAHWKMRKCRYLFQINKRIVGELGHNVLSITQQGIKIKDLDTNEGQLSLDYSKYQLVYEGDYAMNHMDLLTGYVDISKYNGVTSPDYRVFSLRDQNSSGQYYLYLLQIGYIRKVFYGFGRGVSHFGRWRFPTSEFQNFYFPYPPLDEQVNVSNHILEEHERIDYKIKTSTEQIVLLREYKTALINDAVTGKIDVRNYQLNHA